MKFSMSAAWNEAMAMFSANREVLLIVAGIFFFLPNLIVAVAIPGMQQMQEQMMVNPEASQEQMAALLSNYGGAIVAGGLVYFLFMLTGYLALLAMLRDYARPTVGEAISFGALGSLPAFGGLILFYILMLIVLIIPMSLFGAAIAAGGTSSAGMSIFAFVAIVLAVVVMLYIATKFSLFIAVMALDPTFNPVKALVRSWRLTKGNSVRIFGFYLLLLICYFVIAIVVSLPLGLLTLSMGKIGLFINALVSGVISAVVTALFCVLLAAVYRQLAGSSAEAVSETFD